MFGGCQITTPSVNVVKQACCVCPRLLCANHFESVYPPKNLASRVQPPACLLLGRQQSAHTFPFGLAQPSLHPSISFFLILPSRQLPPLHVRPSKGMAKQESGQARVWPVSLSMLGTSTTATPLPPVQLSKCLYGELLCAIGHQTFPLIHWCGRFDPLSFPPTTENPDPNPKSITHLCAREYWPGI